MLWKQGWFSLHCNPCSFNWDFKWCTQCFCRYIHLFLREERQTQNLQDWSMLFTWSNPGNTVYKCNQICGSCLPPPPKKKKKRIFGLLKTIGKCSRTDYPEQFVLSTSLFHFSTMCCKNQSTIPASECWRPWN